MVKVEKISSFEFKPGRVLAKKYKVVHRIGSGWEGEVYKLLEIETGIERAGKFFFPHRNLRNSTLRYHAKKLHKLRNCEILIQYNTQETITFKRQQIPILISEYVDGVMLSEFYTSQPKKRLDPYQALHLLLALAKGVECIHSLKEFHGDIHTDNIIITRYGLSFGVKLIDFFHWKDATSENILDDVCDLLQVYHESIGGVKIYSKLPKEIKQVVCGLKRSIIRKKYKTAGQLRVYLENLNFDSLI